MFDLIFLGASISRKIANSHTFLRSHSTISASCLLLYKSIESTSRSKSLSEYFSVR